MKFLVLIFLGLMRDNSFAADMCSALNPVVSNPLEQLAKDSIKASQISYAKSDMRDFCQRNMLLRFLNIRKLAPRDCDKKTTQELEAIAAGYHYASTDEWDKGPIPTKVTTQLSVIQTLNKVGLGRREFNEVLEELSYKLDSHEFSDNEVTKGSLKEVIKIYDEEKSNSGMMKDATTNIKVAGVCAELSVFKAVQCASVTNKIIAKMTPKSANSKLTNLELWSEVMLNSEYDKGLKLTAKKLIKRLRGEVSSKDNIFKDFTDSFKESGMSSEKAKVASIKMMGLISNGANNTWSRLFLLRGNRTPYLMKDVSLSFIASALQNLDYEKAKKNQPSYSLPEGVDSKCMISKYHHFWMSAYLSWSMINEAKVEPAIAKMSVFTVQKGYQINRDIGRPAVQTEQKIGSVAAVLGKNPHDPVHQIIRTDLALALAGAVWGADTKKKINVDQTIVDLLSASKSKDALSKEERSSMGQMNLYSHWSEVFAPNVAFKSIEGR